MLGDALAAADADRQVRAVLLHGTADCFTAGNDVGDFLKRAARPGELAGEARCSMPCRT